MNNKDQLASLYDRQFFTELERTVAESAKVVVPIVLDLVNPKCVVDVGCGSGPWLREFLKHGVQGLGIDGPHVDEDSLCIPRDLFLSRDLNRPIDATRRFDLVVSLEVAEHLEAESAKGFVEALTRMGDVVLFSAAVPGQGGTHHVNEQWPEYWAELFTSESFLAVDLIRDQIWCDERVAWWYAQNTLLFVRKDKLDTLKGAEVADMLALRRIHPRSQQSRCADARATVEAAGLVDARVLLIDQFMFTETYLSLPSRVERFPLRDGEYAGPPATDQEALEAIKNQQSSVDYVVVLWPAFWWLEYYPSLGRFLNEVLGELHSDENVKIFGPVRRKGTEPPFQD